MSDLSKVVLTCRRCGASTSYGEMADTYTCLRCVRDEDACPDCDICGREEFYDYGRYWCPHCDFKEDDDE